ncbi:MAG: DUF5131 family protein [Desulfomonilaceae bacterium]
MTNEKKSSANGTSLDNKCPDARPEMEATGLILEQKYDWMIPKEISPRDEGSCNVLLVAPHGFPGDDDNVEILTCLLAENEKLDCFAVVNNRKYNRNDSTGKYPHTEDLNDPQKAPMCIDFWRPLVDRTKHIIGWYTKPPLVLFIHGIGNLNAKNSPLGEKGVFILGAGYEGAYSPATATASEKLIVKLRDALTAKIGLALDGVPGYGAASRVPGGLKKQLSKYPIEAIQLEIRCKGYRDTFPNIQALAAKLAEIITGEELKDFFSREKREKALQLEVPASPPPSETKELPETTEPKAVAPHGSKWFDPRDIKTHSAFIGLFTIESELVARITEEMRISGFDPSQPMLLGTWPGQEKPVCIDGHTRLKAAIEAGIKKVPAFVQPQFPSVESAVEYVLRLHSDRRNLTDAGLFAFTELISQRSKTGPKSTEDLAQDCAKLPSGKSAAHVAKLLGVSPRKIEQARTVFDHGTDEIREAVRAGTKTVNRAYQETQDLRRISELEYSGKFNATTESIEWAKWTWNPVTGCLHGCTYCYARDLANRFYTDMPEGERFTPRYRPERLKAPWNTRIPKSREKEKGIRNVFVCSMSDLFGEWVEQEWIDSVLDVCEKTREWTYIFLTKNPKRLATVKFPPNSWVGTTIDFKARVKPALKAMEKVKASVRFISCEPLKQDLTFPTLEHIDWVIVGGQSKCSGEDAFQPEWEWVRHVEEQARKYGCRLYFKPNLDLESMRPVEQPIVDVREDQ